MGERGGISTTTFRDRDGPAGGGDGGGERRWGALPCRVGGGVGARVGWAGGGVIELWGALPCRAGGGVAALFGWAAREG
jgi:hypothetical protein